MKTIAVITIALATLLGAPLAAQARA